MFAALPSRLHRCLWILILAWLACTTCLQAQYRLSPKKPLSPSAEKALATFVESCVPEKRRQLLNHMDGVIQKLDHTVKLAPPEKAALTQKAAAMVDTAVTAWRPLFTEALRRAAANFVSVVLIRQYVYVDPGEAVVREPVEGWKLPDDEPAWTAAIKAILGDQRNAAWQAVVAETARKRDTEIAEFIEPWTSSYRSSLVRQIESRIKRLPDAIVGQPEREAALRKAAQALVNRLADTRRGRLAAMLHSLTDAGREFLDEPNFFNTRFASSADFKLGDLWDQELERLLTPPEIEAWKQRQAEAKARFDKDLPELLKGSLGQVRDHWQKSLDSNLSQILQTVGLPRERAAAFAPAVKAAIASAEQAWVRLATESVEEMDHDTREAVAARGGIYVALPDEDAPENSAAWKSALAKLLTPGELKRLEQARLAHRAHRLRSMAGILIAELDQKVAFTAIQRQALQPVAERLLSHLEELFVQNVPLYGYDLTLKIFYSAAGQAREAEMLTLLDQVQWRRWQEACKTGAKPSRQPQSTPPPARVSKPEPEAVEQRLSRYLLDRSKAERSRLLEDMTLRFEDVARAVALPEPALNRLRIAAKGAAEQGLADWKLRSEQVVRSQVQGATPQNVDQRLAALQEYQFGQRISSGPPTQPIWTNAVKASLNETQRAAWQKEIDARTAYRNHAIAAAVVAEFDRRHGLLVEQSEKLTPMIAALISKYSDDIQGYFSGSTPWYMQSYSCLIPFAGIPEAEFKALLTKEQWDAWAGGAMGNSVEYWSSIVSNHEERKPKPQ